MIASVWDVLFGCTHKKLSWPLSPGHRCGAANLTGTYVVCTDCGAEFAYDLTDMKVVSETSERCERRELLA